MTTVEVNLQKAQTKLVVEALNFYKTSMQNMGKVGKIARQKIDLIDTLNASIEDSTILLRIDKKKYNAFKTKHKIDFPNFEDTSKK